MFSLSCWFNAYKSNRQTRTIHSSFVNSIPQILFAVYTESQRYVWRSKSLCNPTYHCLHREDTPRDLMKWSVRASENWSITNLFTQPCPVKLNDEMYLDYCLGSLEMVSDCPGLFVCTPNTNQTMKLNRLSIRTHRHCFRYTKGTQLCTANWGSLQASSPQISISSTTHRNLLE